MRVMRGSPGTGSRGTNAGTNAPGSIPTIVLNVGVATGADDVGAEVVGASVVGVSVVGADVVGASDVGAMSVGMRPGNC